MNRINVYEDSDDSHDSRPRLAGWFDADAADTFDENTRWDGSNHISVATGSQWDHEMLYRTSGGRWVLHTWSQWQGSTPTYRFITADHAHTWLMANDHDNAVLEHIGPLESERGPGRPEIGDPITVRLGNELLAQVDEYAAGQSMSRAEALRQLVSAGLR